MILNGKYLLLFIFTTFFSCGKNDNAGGGFTVGNREPEKSDEFRYPEDEASEYIKGWVDSLELKIDLPEIDEPHVAQDLYSFYKNRNFYPSWKYTTARELAGLLENIYNEGLSPESYPLDELEGLFNKALNETDAENGARLDVLLSATYLQVADVIATGKVKANTIGGSWHIRPQSPDTLYAHLEKAVNGSVDSSLDYFRPRFAQYEKLQPFIARYTEIIAKGGWPEIEPGSALQPGDSSERIEAIRKRLHISGDLKVPLEQSDMPMVYDSSLINAVYRYQERHGLERTPAITGKMVEAMNVKADIRLKQIMLNLDRIRWFSSGDMPETYVLVNIPEYTLRVFENGREIKRMKVVVGKVMNTTPIFSDIIEYVVFSPYWNVPKSIANDEIWPVAENDPGYLVRNHYEVLDGWGPDANIIPPEEIHWHNLEDYRIRQKPGPWNALGRVKFMFPNNFAVYLHDTPAQQLFDKSHRAFSHGCIRIEEPEWFADWLFPQYNRQEVIRKMNNTKRDVVGLKNKIPVYIFYLTAFVDEEGRINFREDLYELDKRLTEQFDSF